MEIVLKFLPNLIRAALEQDKRTVEVSTLSIIKKIKKSHPVVSEELSKIILEYGAGAPITRSMGMQAPPSDKENFLSLVNIVDNSDLEEMIILPQGIQEKIDRFLKEIFLKDKLIAKGIAPPNSLLLSGPPGVGKTFLTRVISKKLDMPLITLDLASNMSSYLGGTGQNLKKVLDYAKSAPSILFLDEFDAIAKRRDDPTDLGELKRIVNVLLKELEDWPPHSIIVAATNHPEFLDKAIWRRFDLKVELPMPDELLRLKIWTEQLDKEIVNIPREFLVFLSKAIDNISPSDIKQISQMVLREVIIENGDPIKILIRILKESYSNALDSNFNKLISQQLKNVYGNKITQAQIAKMLDIGVSTVNYHLKSTQLK